MNPDSQRRLHVRRALLNKKNGANTQSFLCPLIQFAGVAKLHQRRLSDLLLSCHLFAWDISNIEALNHFDRALHLLKELPKGQKRNTLELELLIARGAPLLSIKGYASDEMEHNYSRAKELSQDIGNPVQKFRAIWGLWVFYLVRGPLADALALAEDFLL